MNEDIVSKLKRFCTCWTDKKCLQTEAVEEIERLRAAIRHLYFNEGVCYGDNCDECELVFGLCDDKTVRGD